MAASNAMTRFPHDCETAEVFHRESRLGAKAAARLKDRIEEWVVAGETEQEWSEPIDAERMSLPRPRFPIRLGFFSKLLSARRSCRELEGPPLSAREAALLLWCATGVTGSDPSGGAQLSAPTAGGLKSTCCYLSSEGGDVRFGTWRYRPVRHELVRVGDMDPRAAAASIMAPGNPSDWPNLLLITARMFPLLEKYGERGYRFALLEAGHVAQNVLLACEGLSLGAVAIGGFDEEALLPKISPASDEALLYVVGFGRRLAKSRH